MATVMRNEPLWGHQVRPCCWLSTREWEHTCTAVKKWDAWSCRYKHTPVNPHRPVWGCWRGAAGLWSAGCDTAAQACQRCSFRCPSAGPWWWKPTPPWQRGCWVMWSLSAAWPHWETLQLSQSRCWSLSVAAGNSGKKKKTDVESTG